MRTACVGLVFTYRAQDKDALTRKSRRYVVVIYNDVQPSSTVRAGGRYSKKGIFVGEFRPGGVDLWLRPGPE